MELDPGVGGVKAPRYRAAGLGGLPGNDEQAERVDVGDALVEALDREPRQEDFCNVQPAAVLWRVVDLEAEREATCLCGREGLVEAGERMGVDAEPPVRPR